MRPNQTAPNPSHIKHIPTIDEFGRSRVELIKNSSHWFMIYSSTNYAHFIASLSYYCVVEKKKNKKKKNRWKSSFEWITITFAYMLTNDTDCNHYHFFSTQIIEYSMQILRNFNSQIKKRHHHLVGSFQSNPRFLFSLLCCSMAILMRFSMTYSNLNITYTHFLAMRFNVESFCNLYLLALYFSSISNANFTVIKTKIMINHRKFTSCFPVFGSFINVPIQTHRNRISLSFYHVD